MNKIKKTKAASLNKKRLSATVNETDSTYVLKLVLYMIIGSQWLMISHGSSQYPLPLGFVIGILFSMHDHFQIDRKIEYAVLLMSVFIGFWIPMGVNIIVR